MKKLQNFEGGRGYYVDDVLALQEQLDKLKEKRYIGLGAFIISGCIVTGNAIGEGLVCIGGKTIYFAGQSGLTFPCYMVAGANVDYGERFYDLVSQNKYAFTTHVASIVTIQPGAGEYITITSTGGKNFFNVIDDILGVSDKAPKASPTFTGTVAGITKAMVGLGSVDNTADSAKPVSTAQQAALNLKANIASPTFTGTVNGITKAMVGLGSVDNTSDANKPVSGPQQTALNLKAPIASPTFTGTVGGITKSMVGLGNVDNTSDDDKPVSTLQGVAINMKADKIQMAWAGLSLSGGSSVGDAASYSPQYMKDGFGFIHVRGELTVTLTAAVATTVATLPAGYRPSEEIWFFGPPIYNMNGSGDTLSISPDGTIKLQCAAGGAIRCDLGFIPPFV